MQNIVGARLSFFRKSILESIRLLKLRSAKHNQEGRIHSATCVDGLVCSLWSLLPSFCNYPVDTAESFKDLEAELCGSLHEEADFHGVICSGLQILIQKNKIIKARENEVFFYTSEVAARNLDVLRSSASEILHILSGIFMKSTKDDGGYLLATICEFASIADKSVVSGLFKIFMEKLLEVKTEADKIHNTNVSCSMEIDNSSNESSLSLMWEKLYDLAVTLLPGLGTKEVDLLFDEVKLALKIQKKAYKLLSTILEHDDSFIARRFEELLKLMYSFFSQASQA